MTDYLAADGQCPIHGKPKYREACRSCNAAYMRTYQRRRRAANPEVALLDRARERARIGGAPFALVVSDITIPAACPVLGTPIIRHGPRSPMSPSLDRIDPAAGYTVNNVRVICDRANRLKGGWSLKQLQELSERSPPALSEEYRLVARYVEREAILRDVRTKATKGGAAGAVWAQLGDFLERRFYPRDSAPAPSNDNTIDDVTKTNISKMM